VRVERAEQAVAMRLAGKSRADIADALGLKSHGGVLSRWLKDVPAPAWTVRPNAKDDLRERAIAMRKDGLSYREIREELGVSKSTLSLWLRDVELTEEQHERLLAMKKLGSSRAGRTMQARRLAKQAATREAAAAQITAVAESELFVAGVVAYWAEGTKSKPWRPEERFCFVNSDSEMITLILRWLDLIGVTRDRLILRVSIHESADVERAEEHWREVTGVGPDQFRRASLKRHNPRTVRKNVGADYHGCLVVNVRRSTELSRQIAGWWAGIIGSVA
jgi:transcriptional regulator with XRE-family HTH domain